MRLSENLSYSTRIKVDSKFIAKQETHGYLTTNLLVISHNYHTRHHYFTIDSSPSCIQLVK